MLILSTWRCGFIIFLSVIQRIIIFPKCNSVPHYLISSKCKQLLFFERFYFSSAFIFRALLFLERFYFSSASISRALLFLERFCFCSLNVSQRLSFVLLGMKQCPIVVSKQFHIYLLFLGLFDYVSNAISNYVQNF